MDTLSLVAAALSIILISIRLFKDFREYIAKIMFISKKERSISQIRKSIHISTLEKDNSIHHYYYFKEKNEIYVRLEKDALEKNSDVASFRIIQKIPEDFFPIKTKNSKIRISNTHKIANDYVFLKIQDFSNRESASQDGNKIFTLTNTETLTMKLLREKANANKKTYVIGFINFGFVMLCYFASTIFNLPIVINPFILFFSMLFILLCYFKQQIFEYRVKKGYYGTCYEEAKDLVKFIVKHNKQNNKDDGGKPIFLKEEIETYTAKILSGVSYA